MNVQKQNGTYYNDEVSKVLGPKVDNPIGQGHLRINVTVERKAGLRFADPFHHHPASCESQSQQANRNRPRQIAVHSDGLGGLIGRNVIEGLLKILEFSLGGALCHSHKSVLLHHIHSIGIHQLAQQHYHCPTSSEKRGFTISRVDMTQLTGEGGTRTSRTTFLKSEIVNCSSLS